MTNNLYRPLLRPAASWTLPPGVTWEYTEVPQYITLRPDLPFSKHPHGVIKLSRELTKAEMQHFDLSLVEEPTARPKTNVTEELEKLVDAVGLFHVVTGLELICNEKAEHIRANWQDKVLARKWETAGKRLYKAALDLPVLP